MHVYIIHISPFRHRGGVQAGFQRARLHGDHDRRQLAWRRPAPTKTSQSKQVSYICIKNSSTI